MEPLGALFIIESLYGMIYNKQTGTE